MVLKPSMVITTCFFFLVSVSWAALPNNDYFQKLYKTINQNIKQGLYEDNLELVEELIKQPAYQELDCYHKGKILHKIGVSYYLLNRESEAITYYKDKVLHLWGDCPQVPPSEKANTIYNIGISYQYLNNFKSAKLYIDKALHIFENDTLYPDYKLAKKYHGIGRFYHDLNDAFRAELYYRNAVNIYKDQNIKVKQFEVVNDLIAMSKEFKEYEKAKEYIDEALSIYRNFPETIPKLNLAWVYLNAGTTHLELKEYKEAEHMALKAIALLDNDKEPYYHAIGLELIAMIQLEEKKYSLAEENLLKSLSLRRIMVQKGESEQSLVHAYENLSDILITKGDHEKASVYLTEAFNIILPAGHFDTNRLPIIKKSKALDDSHLIRLIALKVKIFKTKYETSGDIAFLKKGLIAKHKIDSVINRSLVSFQFEQSKLDFLNLKFEHYGKAVEDALTLHRITGDRFYLEEAYYFSSKTKAIVLQYELNQANAFQSNVSEEIVNHEKALRQEMHNQLALLTEATTKDQDSLLQSYTKAQYELDSYLKEIEQKEPAYFKEKYAFIRPPKLKEVQKNLPKDMAVIEYFVSENKIYGFWLTRNSFFPVTIPYNQEIKTALDDFIMQCHDPTTKISQKISEMIYEKCLKKGIRAIDQDIKRLCIIPDGQLHKLSFEALIDGDNPAKKYVIEDYAISYSYSVALLFREHQDIALQSYIGFGAKYSNLLNKKLKENKRFFGNENLMQLALSHEEIKRGAAIFDGKTFIDNEASLENFLQHSPNADIIHLSLHGLVDIDDPGRSCIIFDDHQEDFILSAQDLYGNRLRADLVLLSACHSASGKIYSGEGVQGMSKSFLLGGAHNILSSLWNASEASSMAITTSFLEYVHESKPIDLALHQSKLDYLSKIEPNKRHPYYWANFILLGEVGTTQDPTNPIIWILIVSVLLLVFFIVYTPKIWIKRLKF